MINTRESYKVVSINWNKKYYKHVVNTSQYHLKHHRQLYKSMQQYYR